MSATSPAAWRRGAAREGPAHTVSAADIAWLAVLPCALLALAAIAALAPSLGHLLVRPGPYELWPTSWWNARGQPELREQGAYVVAALAPLLLAAVVLARPRIPALPPRTTRALVTASQLAVVAFVAIAVLGQNDVVLADPPRPGIFGLWTFVAAAALLALAAIGARRERLPALAARIARETPARRAACLAVAVAVPAVWLIKAITTDGLTEDLGFFNWTLNDAFAVLDGRTPLVDYRPIYGKLYPYPAALTLLAFGKTGLVYSVTAVALSVLAMVAVYAVYRRVARSSVLALGLFVPFVATTAIGDTTIMPAMWPMRYGGAYLLAWLTARSCDGERPRHVAVLCFLGALAFVNSNEFGLATLLATIAALACARPPASPRAALVFARQVAGGVLGALAAVCALTLVRAGALPDPATLEDWPRIIVGLGWFSEPMPIAGLHLALYATFAAAIATAAVRVRQGGRDRLLTGMLAWSGVFGIVAGSYFVGTSTEVKLAAMLSAWSFALGFLTVAVVRALAARGWERPSPAQLLVLLGFAVTLCSVSRLPPPAEQIRYLTQQTPPLVYRPAAERFVAQRTQPGERVAILLPESFRIAYDLGLENVSPYEMSNAIVTRRQLRTLLDAVRAERAERIFVPAPGARLTGEGDTPPAHLAAYAAAGWTVRSGAYGMLELARR